MVKWKGVMKISSKMRSKMERSNKNIRTKCNCISLCTIQGSGNWERGGRNPGPGSKPGGRNLFFIEDGIYEDGISLQSYTASTTLRVCRCAAPASRAPPSRAAALAEEEAQAGAFVAP